MPFFLALINLSNITIYGEGISVHVYIMCYFLLYPMLHLLIILFPLSSEAEAYNPASGAITRQVSPERGCGPIQL